MTKEQLMSRVQSLLKTTRLNQSDIAAVLGIPRTAISSLANSTRELSAWEALKLCQILNISPDQFFLWKNRPDGDL